MNKTRNLISVCVSAAVFTLAAAFFAPPLFLSALLSAALHEAGHVLMGHILGLQYSGFSSEPGGLVIAKRGFSSYRNDIWEAAAGPGLNALLALASAAFGRIFCSEALFAFSGLNAALAVFNLLPCLPLDGGRILFALIALIFGIGPARRALCVVSCITIFLLLGGGIYAMQTGGGAALLTAAVCIFFSYCKEGENGIK